MRLPRDLTGVQLVRAFGKLGYTPTRSAGWAVHRFVANRQVAMATTGSARHPIETQQMISHVKGERQCGTTWATTTAAGVEWALA